MTLGMSRGSYSRSASWTMMMSPVASVKPRRSAAPLPWFFSWKSTLSSLRFFGLPPRKSTPFSASCWRNSRLPSLEQSSTSTSCLGKSTAMQRVSSSARVGISL